MDTKTELAPGLIRETLHHGRIVILRVDSVTRETLDIGYNAVYELQEACSSSRLPMLLLYDLSPYNFTITPYVRQLISRLNASNPHVTGRVAVVLPKSPATAMIKLFVGFLARSNRVKRIFFSEDQGVRWLEELL